MSTRFLKNMLSAAVAAQLSMGVAQLVSAENANFDIQHQRLDQALTQFAEQANIQLIFSKQDAQVFDVAGISGNLDIDAALSQLLSGTGLKYSYSSENTVVIKTTAGAGDAKSVDQSNRVLEEMIVTATKRAASAQDLSMSITAIGHEEIERRGLVGMADYLAAMPSLSVMDQGPGRVSIVMRGISANPQSEGVEGALSGVYFGETPISGFGIHGNSADLKLVDMERVEVLRGPQGTLYGSSTVGGTVRNIPVSPDLNQLAGSVKLGYSHTGGFGGANSKMEGVVNIPVVEGELGIRLIAYQHKNSGFIKNVAGDDPAMLASAAAFGAVVVNEDDIGKDDYTGFRAAALWQPTEQLSIELMHVSQDTEQDGWGQSDLEVGSFLQRRQQLRHNTNPPNFGEPEFGEEMTDDLSITNAVIQYDFGWATLLSSSSWLSEDYIYNRELSGFFAPAFIPWSQPTNGNAESFIEEIRLATQFEGPMQFLVGYFYEDSERYFENWGLHGGDPALNPFAPGVVLNLEGPHRLRNLKQHAIFGEVSYDLSEKITVTGGARVFKYEQDYSEVSFDSVFVVDSVLQSTSNENDVNFKASIDYTPSDDTLLYALWSEGFRLGRPVPADTNPACDTDNDGIYDGSNNVSTGPRNLDSDFVENFEVGGKFTLLQNRMQINASVFRINWEGMPVVAIFDFCGTTLNAGKAVSQGMEFETTYQISDSLLLNFGASYVQAELTEDVPQLNGVDGDRLPGSPEYNFSLGMQYDFLLAGYDAFVRGDFGYVGGFYNNLQQTGLEVADYGKLNIRSGVVINNINVDVFVDNVTNEDNLVWLDKEISTNPRGYHLRPRTVGVSLGYKF